MTPYRTELGQVIYNPQTRAYEALVSFHENGDVTRIPCALAFPIDAESSVVAAALVRQAQEKRRNIRVPLISRIRAQTAPANVGIVARRLARQSAAGLRLTA